MQTSQYSAEFGRSAGGVVNIPKRRCAAISTEPERRRLIRDKVFWFGNYEGLRNPSSSYAQFIVPTAAEKAGDFSRSGYDVFDPLTTRLDPSNPSPT